MITANEAADFFIKQADVSSGDVMTHLKLQKLLYYAQGWHLALYGTPLFNDKIEAWAHGPVCPSVWRRFGDRGWDTLSSSDTRNSISTASKEEEHLLSEIWRVYGQFTAKRLEEMTHEETPYIEARGDLPEYAKCSEVITHRSMKAYFSKRKSERKT
jgi:uncharacterized phage-associated protein